MEISSVMFYLLASIVIGFYLAGFIAIVHVIMNGRTAQGTVGWTIALLELPYIALPLYLIIGSHRFWGYVKARRSGNTELHHIVNDLILYSKGRDLTCDAPDSFKNVIRSLTKLPLTQGNHAQLLIDGEKTFQAMFESIDAANDYILIQFFIIRDDYLGRQLKDKLIAKAQTGVRVYFLYDEIGCFNLPNHYLRELKQAGIDVTGFKTTRGWVHPLRINFRNHRKIIIVDGYTAFAGGFNVGDEYMGKSSRFGHWRDTHLKLQGPSVHILQLTFCEDWYWATHTVPTLHWEPGKLTHSDQRVLPISSGPADQMETCTLFFVHAINAAKTRLWIVSPYFVPDEQVMTALQLAALRGVDVRILLPAKPDHLLVYLSSWSYYEQAEQAGVKIYRYQTGFLHQKVMLIDNDYATVGTANFDNRSFRINFEMTVLVINKEFCKEVEVMLEEDFSHSSLVCADEYACKPFWYKLAVRSARLLSPLQ
ncbi:Cardiolipin synthetase [hydrothermal vent metagenome]|uniref:Cardiolipin synthetase n=1 Tax=hydrothermal vent metagenome TaxID=652676 RepID=A0A3B1BJS0_9ZZZZ